MKTNRIAILVLSLSLIAGALWAAGSAEESSAGTEEPFRIAVIMPSATTDTAFSQSMWQALKSVQADMGGGYNRNGARLILAEVQRDHRQNAVDGLIREFDLETLFGNTQCRLHASDAASDHQNFLNHLQPDLV